MAVHDRPPHSNSTNSTSIVIIGSGPGGYEAALVARQLGATVTLIDRDGIGGSAVLTDCVPSKALIATSNAMLAVADSGDLGVLINGLPPISAELSVHLGTVNARVRALADAQSTDIASALVRDGVTILHGAGAFVDANTIAVTDSSGVTTTIPTDITLIATGARPRILDTAIPDGERILTWDQVYALQELPEKLIVVGSGVTGAEFASAYQGLGSEVILVSSRDRVLPSEDEDAARVIESVFERRGVHVMSQARAVGATRTEHGVAVELQDGRVIEGSHVLLALGSVPNTDQLNLDAVGVHLDDRGFIEVDRVSRTTMRNIYAAGDCTGVLMLASVAAMQGRIAMWHALGDAVTPLQLDSVSSTVFTEPEIATVGVSQKDIDSGDFRGDVVMLALESNARAKMQEQRDGFIKIFCRKSSRIIAGAVVVSPHASELIHPLTLAINERLTVDELASTFTVYPSLSGSIAEAARRLHRSHD
ncbi:MAG: NAD(P)H-quinone dehydrogenase [Candidatus Nanopelagicales bacterium]|nr:NAD(P)H-quinone dehydrogenase [Candidatus Nanopelagicales bacterium]MCF8539468.1 NAD(P)H-quinone dehydrogenase [Candidatus Nanopelagicales bacterium]MCF8551445.1 NAD(P)H-quinone dehydrogenase [Candidatus Nanopelagicales bacterium]